MNHGPWLKRWGLLPYIDNLRKKIKKKMPQLVG